MKKNIIAPNPIPEIDLPELDKLGWFLAGGCIGLGLGLALCALAETAENTVDDKESEASEKAEGGSHGVNSFS